MKDIPAIIKAARIKCGYTQQELGEKLEYTGETAQVSVRRWETGKAPVPLVKIRALAAALNLTVDDLVP
jgi:transcriptional regulator with XRE-family HTH domain